MTTELQFLSVRELGGLLRTQQVSPVELAEFFLNKLESEGPKYNALVSLTRERALKQAKQAEREIASGEYRGPLHGIPYGLKDLVATAGGTPTTWGAVPFQDQTFDYDATIVQKLDAAGAVLVAKLAMVELAGGMGYLYPSASATGPAITPWGNKDSWTGGSSSGSGAAVAAGLVPFAIGSETWGSILLPRPQLRHRRAASHLWQGEPVWRHGALLDSGQAGADVPHRRRLRSGARRYCRPRPQRPHHQR